MSWRWALARRVAALSSDAAVEAQRCLPSYTSSVAGAGALLWRHYHLPAASQIRSKVVGCRRAAFVSSRCLHDAQYQVPHDGASSRPEERQDPFELVADELSLLANRLRSMVAAEVPKLASAAEYFFKVGAEGKRFRPTVLLLMASALKFPIPESTEGGVLSILSNKLRTRQQNIAEITEMIHVASLLHDDVLDDADTRRSVESHYGMEYYLQKTYYKTASLISNSCKAVAILAGHTADVSVLAYEYGRNLGLAFQLIDDVLDFTGTSASLGKGSLSDIRHGIITAPMLYAMEEFPQLHDVVDQGFENPANVDLALDYLRKSRGIERTKELAREHADRAIKAIEALPDSDDEDVLTSRRALIDITERVITRTK
ncbi:hypothetical protein PR202_gb06144 [Eleusine coracana subsp. coracana]|uniref:Uncharacterized protein n=1 Tax=Eleusine coracana subsp. coracana TaxID=191504 RepID=A0AAV5E859_ELECO|nr:hypothetical protein PR202_gb06144 [Eleusine coracana subsp. coracana]